MPFITLHARGAVSRSLALLLFALCGGSALAASETFGDYTVHYSTVHSTFVDPDIAARYDIVRGRRNAFLNVAVLRNNEDGSTTPVSAGITGGKRNLLTQQAAIDFKEVREGDAIYYIGQFEFSHGQLLRFTVEVQPEMEGPAYKVKWETTLYSTD